MMRIVLAVLLAISTCACTNENQSIPPAPHAIVVGVLPDQSKANLATRYGPLVDYLEAATGLHIELEIPSSYEQMLDDFDTGRLDVAAFGGLTYVQAEQRSRAQPLVMRDVDLQFLSCYLVRAADARGSLADFKGTTFAFGPRLSTSGHLMPRYFLNAGDMPPEEFFASIRHSSGHDQTVEWVRDGDVVIGVANCDIAQSMLDNRDVSANSIRILDTTPAYANYVWATQQSLDASIKTLLRDAFLALNKTNPEHRALLMAQGANGFLPAGKNDFEDVRAAVREIGLVNMAN